MEIVEIISDYADLAQQKGRRKVLFGETAGGELVELGNPPRLTLGERLLKKYKRFLAVDVAERPLETTHNLRSLTGTMEFTVRFSLKYRVSDPRLVATERIDPKLLLIEPLLRKAARLAEQFPITEFKNAQRALNDLNDDSGLIERSRQGFCLTDIHAEISPDNDHVIEENLEEKLRSVKLRIAAALAEGNRTEASCLQEAYDFMQHDHERQKIKAKELQIQLKQQDREHSEAENQELEILRKREEIGDNYIDPRIARAVRDMTAEAINARARQIGVNPAPNETPGPGPADHRSSDLPPDSD